MASRRRINKKRRTPIASVLLVAIVVTVMVGGVWATTRSINSKLDTYHEKEKILQEQIDAERARAEEIEEYSKYVQTNAYVEQVAKEKLGLVFEDEIIFKKEN